MAVSIGPLPAPGPSSFSNTINGFSVDSDVSTARIGRRSTVAVALSVGNRNGVGVLGAPRLGFPGSFRACRPGIAGDFGTKGDKLDKRGHVRCLMVPHRGKRFAVPSISVDCFSLRDKTCEALRDSRFIVGITGNRNNTSRGRIITAFAGRRSITALNSSVHCLVRSGKRLGNGNRCFTNSVLF